MFAHNRLHYRFPCAPLSVLYRVVYSPQKYNKSYHPQTFLLQFSLKSALYERITRIYRHTPMIRNSIFGIHTAIKGERTPLTEKVEDTVEKRI